MLKFCIEYQVIEWIQSYLNGGAPSSDMTALVTILKTDVYFFPNYMQNQAEILVQVIG